ncbi:DEK C terminal domain-containing protein [Xylaria intraflava]|nr:DEK C terminal domain-containing protein [Xylaria intraflava]
MAKPLTAEEEARYTEIIDGILATADLETVTRKKIRLGLQAELGGKDLNEQKDAIKALIEERFDAISAVAVPNPPATAVPETSAPISPGGLANGHNDVVKSSPDVNGDKINVWAQPPKKKQRKDPTTDTEDADAKLAALLQAEENQRTRTTRGGAKATTKKKKPAPKKKSEKRVKAGDDSDGNATDGGSPKKRKAGGGFQKPFNLSYPLAELCGESQLSRPQVVKKLWEHIKEKQLQDPSDKRQIICDESMQAVFKLAKVDMFQMNKLVGNHLYPVEEGA